MCLRVYTKPSLAFVKHILPIIPIFAGIILQNCIDCGPQAELSASVYFNRDSPRPDSIYAFKALDQKVIDQAESNTSPYGPFQLPISLVSDTTTYIFRTGDHLDTLSIYYKRIFRYKGGCGFINDVTEPSHGNHYKTTFRSVEISYDTYVRPGKQSWTNDEPGTGMSIRIEP